MADNWNSLKANQKQATAIPFHSTQKLTQTHEEEEEEAEQLLSASIFVSKSSVLSATHPTQLLRDLRVQRQIEQT